MKKRYLLIILSVILLVFLVVKFVFGIDYSIFRFNISKETRLKYINVVDSVSQEKIQVNWREVVAVDATFNYGRVDTATESNIKRVAERFIVEDNKKYYLRSMDDVVTSFNGKREDMKKANQYLKVINKQRETKSDFKKEFFTSIKDEAIKVSKQTGILPSVILGQAALESNWGKSLLSSEYNNLFGIKADSSWKGERINLSTSEYYNEKIKDNFRVYKNKDESVDDFGKFLKNNPRYNKAGVFDAKTYKQQIAAIENAGYSTITDEKGEKVYAKYVLDIIMSNDLQLLDWQIKR